MERVKKYCGCMVDPNVMDHVCHCPRFHIMTLEPSVVPAGSFRSALCGVDSYKVNHYCKAFKDRDTGKIFLTEGTNFSLDAFCQTCLDILTR